MKKIALLGLAASLAFVSCKKEDDTDGGGSTYPTDGLTVDAQQNVFIMEMTGTWCQYCPNGAELMKVETATHGNRLVAFATHQGASGPEPMENAASIALNGNFLDGEGFPTFSVMNENAGQSPSSYVLAALNPIDLPHFGVKHAVTVGDTAYTVYPKVEVLRGVTDENFFVQSYLLLDAVEARDYGNGMDFNQVSSVSAVSTGSGSTPTKWVLDAAVVDGEAQYKSGDTYMHEEVLWGFGNNVPSLWGANLDSINPFKQEYIEGDVLGTQYTPIKINIPKDDLSPINSSVSIASVIWKFDEDTGLYTYVNGYVSHID